MTEDANDAYCRAEVLSGAAERLVADEAVVSCQARQSAALDAAHPSSAQSWYLPAIGRLPRHVVRVLNAAWDTAGEQVPSESVLSELGAQFGPENLPRLRKFFLKSPDVFVVR